MDKVDRNSVIAIHDMLGIATLQAIYSHGDALVDHLIHIYYAHNYAYNGAVDVDVAVYLNIIVVVIHIVV